MLTHASTRVKVGLAVAAFVTIAIAIQGVVTLGFLGYCSDSLEGTSRETICRATNDGGYVAIFALPPLAVLTAGAVAVRRHRIDVAVWAFGLALLLGIGIPLVTGLVVGYE